MANSFAKTTKEHNGIWKIGIIYMTLNRFLKFRITKPIPSFSNGRMIYIEAVESLEGSYVDSLRRWNSCSRTPKNGWKFDFSYFYILLNQLINFILMKSIFGHRLTTIRIFFSLHIRDIWVFIYLLIRLFNSYFSFALMRRCSVIETKPKWCFWSDIGLFTWTSIRIRVQCFSTLYIGHCLS